MNQTDGPEMERALRAATCDGCEKGWPLRDDETTHVIERTLEQTYGVLARRIFQECTSAHRELLPLFQQAVAGAYAAAAKLVANLKEAPNCKGVDSKVLRYEAVDKIKALTPADARQAQTDRMCQAISDFCLLTAKRVGMELDAAKHETFGDAIQAAIASAEARAYKRCADLVDFGDGDKPSLVMLKWADEVTLAAARTPDRTKEQG